MKLVINGADVELDGRYAKTPLPRVLRDVAGLHGAKFGCGAGFCAARTVLIDGRKHEVLLDRDRAGGGQGNQSRGGLQPGCRRRPHSKAVSAGSKPCDTSSEKVDPLRRRIDSGTGVSGALTMPATSLQAAAEEVVKRDPGLTRAHRSSRVHRWLSRRTVMSFTLDPQVAEALHPFAVAMAGSTPPPAGDATARPSANSGQPSYAFFGGRRSVK